MPQPRPAVVPSIKPMTVAEARRILGREAEDMTDAEVLEAVDQADALADIVLQMFTEQP